MTKLKDAIRAQFEMDCLNGGRAELRVGAIVTPKPDVYDGADSRLRQWKEWRVEEILSERKGLRHVLLKAPDGTTSEHLTCNLLLTSSSELQALAQLESIREMVAALQGAETSQNEDLIDDARQTIQEDPLSVEVRSGWLSPGLWETIPSGERYAEFRILLCTGGPAVQIIGELNEHAEPEKPRLQHQDWGTPWTDVRLSAEDEETLLAYCREFYFGE